MDSTGVNDDQVPMRATIFGYRGELYEAPIVSDDWVGLTPHGTGSLSERFPDAIEFGENAAVGPWVKVPRSAIESALARRVTARWKGVPVEGVHHLRRGPAKGRMQVWAIENWKAAEAAGFQGSDYGGWKTNVKLSALSDVKVEMVEMPVHEAGPRND